MACYLFDAKPLLEPMLPYCQLDSWEQISMKFEPEFKKIHLKKWSAKMLASFVQGEVELTIRHHTIVWTHANASPDWYLPSNFVCTGPLTINWDRWEWARLYCKYSWKTVNINTLRLRQNEMAGIFKCILLNKNVWIPIDISLKLLLRILKIWQYISTGADNGLLPDRQEGIIWTNGGLVYCIYASMR